jgi:hypothetical protein
MTRTIVGENGPESVEDKRKLFEPPVKRARTRTAPREILGLTCNEANVDSILSEGEST